MKKLINRLMRFFFQHLYHSLAWSYDWIAALVSFGSWYDWVKQILPYVSPEDTVLEIGFGTGVLFTEITRLGNQVFGVDESHQMIRRTRKRVNTLNVHPRITRARAEKLPFKDNVFSLVLATFPSEYLFADSFQHELRRILKPGGRLVSLFAVSFSGKSLLDRFYHFLYRLTGQNLVVETLQDHMQKMGTASDLRMEIETISDQKRTLFFLTAQKLS